jgi:hypothetical protein
MMKLAALSILAILAFSSSARADDCEAKRIAVFTDISPSVDPRTSSSVYFRKDGALIGVDIVCFTRPDAVDVLLTWRDGGDPPSVLFWSLVSSIGTFMTGVPSAAIEDGARTCLSATLGGKDGKIKSDKLTFGCSVVEGKSYVLISQNWEIDWSKCLNEETAPSWCPGMEK